MSNNPEDIDFNFHPLSFKELEDYLEWKSKEITCEICGDNSWGIMTGHDGSGFVLTRVSFVNYTPQGSVPLFAMECTNCGNMKLFRQHGIRDKIIRRRLSDLEKGGD